MSLNEWIYAIQKLVDFIDNNAKNNPSLYDISKQAGYSPHYCSSQFHRIAGMTIKSYMAKRRLYMAAIAVRDTDKRLIDIALEHGFFGQNSLTRAFKDAYGCTPAAFRKNPACNISMNELRTALEKYISGGNNMNGNNAIKGWFLAGLSPQKYQMFLDESMCKTGTKSASLKSSAEEYDDNDFATIMQQFNAKNFLEKRVQFSAFVRTQDVNGWCGLWMRIDDDSGNLLKFDNMQTRAITGTTEWNCYSCVLDVPDNAAVINIGMLLGGTGQAWMDDTGFQVVDNNTPTTDTIYDLPGEPMNLSFEE